MTTSCAGPLPPGPAVNRPSRNLGGTFFFTQNMNTNQLHPLALEIVNRIHGGEPPDKIINTIRQDHLLRLRPPAVPAGQGGDRHPDRLGCAQRSRVPSLPVGVTNAIHELAAAERRLERLRVQARQAEADAERLAVELNEAVQTADAAKLLEVQR